MKKNSRKKKPFNKAKIASLTEALSSQLLEGYQSIAGIPYREALGKTLSYPTTSRLTAERIYYQYPLAEFAILGYILAIAAFFFAWTLKKASFDRVGRIFTLLAFLLHTFILGLRCYILQRPPVSNMFETVLYVPWIAVLTGLVFRKSVVMAAADVVAFALLLLLQMTNVSNGLENVQAVLDSQYWLLIHVLMVVGSYGAFFLSGILGHAYLAGYLWQRKETPSLQFLAKFILQSMYVGVALLIPGTILGGVWAAESWGRFWDWDPKESWAFISSCIYLIWIHAYTFQYVRNFGLAVGSIVGLLAISFTWYGVNYILGTGLHSYGFGSGGDLYYYLFFLAELIFLLNAIGQVNRKKNADRQDS